MKHLSAIFTGLALFAALAAFACFDHQGHFHLHYQTLTDHYGGSTTTDVQTPEWTQPETQESWVEKNQGTEEQPQDENANYKFVNIGAVINASFPFTLRISFSGFLDEEGNEVKSKIGRLALFYWAKSGEWATLVDLENPKYDVIREEGDELAVFGPHTIPNALGYTKDEFIPVVMYFASSDGLYENFNLTVFKTNRLLKSAADRAGATILAIIPSGNTVPY